ncbi:hypothetical protein Trydic_g5981 [Trypoxylus dichotomus]
MWVKRYSGNRGNEEASSFVGRGRSAISVHRPSQISWDETNRGSATRVTLTYRDKKTILRYTRLSIRMSPLDCLLAYMKTRGWLIAYKTY